VAATGAFFAVSFFFFLKSPSGPGGGGGGPPAGRFSRLCPLFEESFLLTVSLCFLKGLIFFKSSPGGGGGGGGPGGPDCENAADDTAINPNVTVHIKRNFSLAEYPLPSRIGAMCVQLIEWLFLSKLSFFIKTILKNPIKKQRRINPPCPHVINQSKPN